MTQEKTFLAVKPTSYARGEAAAVVEMLTKLLPDAKCLAMKVYTPSKELAGEHYAAHSDKPFFPELVDSFTSGPILGMVWQGDNIVARAREAMGATDPAKAAEGTIRKRLGRSMGDNIIHGSDTDPGSAEREVGLHFPEANWSEIKDPEAKARELAAVKV